MSWDHKASEPGCDRHTLHDVHAEKVRDTQIPACARPPEDRQSARVGVQAADPMTLMDGYDDTSKAAEQAADDETQSGQVDEGLAGLAIAQNHDAQPARD